MPEGHASFKTNAISCFLYQYEPTDLISYQLVITAHFAYLMVVYSEAYVNERGAARKYIKDNNMVAHQTPCTFSRWQESKRLHHVAG